MNSIFQLLPLDGRYFLTVALKMYLLPWFYLVLFFFYLRYYVMPLHVKFSLLNIQYVHVLVLLDNRPFAR